MLNRIALAVALCLISFRPEAAGPQLAPVIQAAQRGQTSIVDLQGRVKYIVMLTRDAQAQFDNSPLPPGLSERLGARHSARALRMAAAFESRYGFASVGMSSLVANAIVAYLTFPQVQALRADPLVAFLEEATRLRLSSGSPPWTDSVQGSTLETYSWGRTAVNGTFARSTPPAIYVLDAGVGFHTDLPSVERQDAWSTNATQNPAPTGYLGIGCYPHATHVAGIIGAPIGNGGTAGVIAGASIVSIGALEAFPDTDASGFTLCMGQDAPDSSVLALELDWIKGDLIHRTPGRAGVVNISNNSVAYGPVANVPPNLVALRQHMAGAAAPDWPIGYGGVFIAQSAGNDFSDACAFAYANPTTNYQDPSDGIMVVGGLNSSGRPVGSEGFANTETNNPVSGSNYGGCVETWAPADQIMSTWAAYPQLGTQTYSDHVRMGGTSMAAPHVAGVAAALLQLSPSMSPAQIEGAIRNYAQDLNVTDAAGTRVKMARLPDPKWVVPVINQILNDTASP